MHSSASSLTRHTSSDQAERDSHLVRRLYGPLRLTLSASLSPPTSPVVSLAYTVVSLSLLTDESVRGYGGDVLWLVDLYSFPDENP